MAQGDVDVDTVGGKGGEVIGDVVAAGLRDLGPQVADVDLAGGRGGDGVPDGGHGNGSEDTREKRAGADHDLVGVGDGGEGAIGRAGVGRDHRHTRDAPGVRDGDLAFDGHTLDLGLEHDRLASGGEHVALEAEQAARLVQRHLEV